MVPKLPRDMSPVFFFFWLLAGFLEYPVMAVLIGGDKALLQDRPGYFAGTHALAVLVLFFAPPKGRGWFHPARLWGRNFVFFAAFLPIFGWIVSGLTFLVYRDPEKPEDIFEFEKEEARLSEPTLSLVPLKETRENRLYKILDFMPLADVLAGSDSNLKRGAVEKLARLATPESIAVLLAHRSDPNPEVRFYVTSALTGVKKQFDEELEAAKRQLKENLDDVNVRYDLAKIYLRYVQSGLLDDVTAQTFETEAFHHLDQVTNFPDASEMAFLTLIELCKRHGRWPEAIAALRRFEDFGHAEGIAVEKIRIEIFYGAGRFDEVRRGLMRLKGLGFSDPAWDAAAYLWGAS